MKKCITCNQVKEINAFEKERNACRVCRNKQRQLRPRQKYEVVKQDKCCGQCNITKPYTEFNVDLNRIDGLHPYCKQCRSGRNSKRYQKNVDKIKQKTLQYYQENKVTMLKKRNERAKVRRKTDPMYLMKRRIRNRTYLALRSKGWNKNNKFVQYIGCSQEELKLHIEKQFVTGMSWENANEWHVDHIIPLDSADTIEDLYRLSYYTNLQPMWATDNIKKGAKI